MADGVSTAPKMWWSGYELVNAVFKGGGARGVAYAGALQAVAARRTWFASVAGASAGAITASLIAAGCTPDRIAQISADGLASVKRGLLKTIVGRSNAIFANDGLQEWIETQLRAALPGRAAPATVPVTFGELFTATGVGLYVLTMDLHGREPMIFHHQLTPHASVSAAVVASCAIPGAFPSGRAVVGDDANPTVRELVDGGAWANFPWFVYADRAFRAWLPFQDTVEEGRPIWGFVLDDELRRPRQRVRELLSGVLGQKISRRFDLGPSGTSGSVGAYVMSAILGSDAVRLVTGVVVLLWGGVTLAALPRTARWLVQLLGRSAVAPFSPLLAFLAVAALALVAGLVVVAAVVALALGRVLSDTVLPAAQAAMGVATGVPPWVGAARRDTADRVITVPATGLSTTRFTIPEAKRLAAVESAYNATLAQLDGRPVPPRAEEVTPLPSLQALAVRLVRTVLVTVVVLRILVWAVSDLEAEHPLRGIGWLVVAAAGLLFVMGLTARKAQFRASHAVGRTPQERAKAQRWGQGLAAAGALVIVGGLVLGAVRFDRNEREVVNARIVAAQVDGDSNRYQFIGRVRSTGEEVFEEFRSDIEYRLGEHLFMARVAPQGEEWRAARQLTLDSFTIPIVLVILGLGLLSSGVRELRWELRDRRLGAPVAAGPAPSALAPDTAATDRGV